MKLLNSRTRKKAKRRYLRLAALYRRAANRNDPGLDFSEAALMACRQYESTGKPPPGLVVDTYKGMVMPCGRINGYLLGKWMLDISVADAKREVQSGNFAKIEFYKGPTAWYWRSVLNSVKVPVEGYFAHLGLRIVDGAAINTASMEH